MPSAVFGGLERNRKGPLRAEGFQAEACLSHGLKPRNAGLMTFCRKRTIR
jgi:hypothetical protein